MWSKATVGVTEPACAGLRSFTFSIELALKFIFTGLWGVNTEGEPLKHEVKHEAHLWPYMEAANNMMMMNEAKAELPNSAFPVVATWGWPQKWANPYRLPC